MVFSDIIPELHLVSPQALNYKDINVTIWKATHMGMPEIIGTFISKKNISGSKKAKAYYTTHYRIIKFMINQ